MCCHVGSQVAALAVESVVKRLKSFDDVAKYFKQTTILTDGTYYQAGDTHYTDKDNINKHDVIVKSIPDTSEGWFGIYRPFADEVAKCVSSKGLSYHGGASFVLRIDGVSGFESQIKTLICDYPPTARSTCGREISTFDFWEERRNALFPIGNVFLKYNSVNTIDTIDVTKPVLIIYGDKSHVLNLNTEWGKRPYEIIFLERDGNSCDKVFNDAYAEKLERKEGRTYLQKLKSLPSALFDLLFSVDGKPWTTMGLFFVPTRSTPDTLTALMCPLGIDDSQALGVFDALYWELQSLIRIIGAGVEAEVLLHKTRFQHQIASTQSAIGSIMSRNGSHNIGSHVLSALSHNVGTMPDDRVLYQYIQHRMDYIATATTEFPQWTTPTMFVAGLMKNFYAQKHLLDYISRSEGLRAYKFQGRNLDDAARMNQHGTIRIFMRRLYELGKSKRDDKLPDEHRYLTYDLQGQARSIYYFFGEKDTMFRQNSPGEGRVQYEISESGGTAKFLEYGDRFTPDWSQDVKIAIPGGIVGQHAFYTIIENVIRNAAKHGWAAKGNLSEKDLEVYIDFMEDDNKGEVVFAIWDNVSDVFGGAKVFWDKLFADSSCPNNKELLRAYSTCLEPNETKQLEEYLKEKNKDECGGVLPSIYQKQREYLLEDLRKYNTRRYIKPRKDGNNLYEFSCEDETIWHEIIKAVVWEGFDREIVLNSGTYKNHIDESAVEKFDRIIKILKRWSMSAHRHGLVSRLILQLLREIKGVLINQFQLTPDDINRISQFYSKDESGNVVECLVYAYLSQRVSDGWPYKKFLTSNAPSNPDWKLGRRLILPLHHDLQRKLAQPFINPDGKLRKENWGLAEMKISAGYLDQRKTSEIGGLDEKGNDIIIPVAMPGVCRNADNPHNCLACSERAWNKMPCRTDENCPFAKRRFHLGYQFRIAKPKNILVVLSKPLPQNIKAKLSGAGINFAYADETRDKNGRLVEYKIKEDQQAPAPMKLSGYRYVVVPELPSSKEEEAVVCSQLCFRCVTHKDIVFSKSVVHTGQGQQSDDEVKLVDLLEDEEKRNSFLKDLDDNGKKGEFELCKAVQSAWVRKLAAECGGIKDRPVKLIVNVDGNENGSERGLVTRKDLLRTMFVECYHTALIAFLKNPPESVELSDTTCHLIALLSLIKVVPDKMVEPQQDYGHGDDYGAKEYIRAQLVAYCDLFKSHLLLSSEFVDALKSIERYGKNADGKGDAIIARKIEDIEENFEKSIARRLFRGKQDEDDKVRQVCEELIAFLRKVDKVDLDGWLDAFHDGSDKYRCPSRKDSYQPGRHTFDDNLKAIINACSVPEEDEFNALVESLNSMFLASDVYLRKYEERIATLPEAYKHDGSEHAAKTTDGTKTEDVQDIAESLIGRKLEKESDCVVVKYSRHDHAMPKNGVYAEALSGSQSYLNALSRLVCASGMDSERYAAVARLLENAFLRILIIDERVMNFVNDHLFEEMVKTFINMGIWIADVEHEGVAKASSEVTDELYRFHYGSDVVAKDGGRKRSAYVDIPSGQFDVLVIHQGIIDKKWERHDKDKVKEILDDLRLSIPRVVVTTGRGRPENIPEDEKVLPFSVIESSLFRRYPEKPVFVNTIMNLLPYGKREGTV